MALGSIAIAKENNLTIHIYIYVYYITIYIIIYIYTLHIIMEPWSSSVVLGWRVCWGGERRTRLSASTYIISIL